MVRFINKLTGGEMWVHESRVEEYKAAGHKPAAEASETEAPKPEAKRRSTAKTKK